MADNIAITPGTGATVSTEEVTTLNGGAVSAQHVQRTVQSARTANGVAVDVAKAEDVASADGDVGLPILAVRQDAPANSSGTDGDFEFLRMSAGRLWASSLVTDGTRTLSVIADSTAYVAQTGLLVGGYDDSNTMNFINMDQTTLGVKVAGGGSVDGPNFGVPVAVGGRASATAPSNVSADNDLTNSWFLLDRAGWTAIQAAAGALIGGDATNGLDVDVTRAPSSSATGAAIPSQATMFGLSDGTNLVAAKQASNAFNATAGGAQIVALAAQLDDTAPTAITENNFGNLRMSPLRALHTEQNYTATRLTADGQIKASAGFVHTVSIAPTTATPTAGLVQIFDNTAESGTVLYSEWFAATTTGHTIVLDCVAATGIFVGYDATLANVSVTVSFR